ncbi:MAG: methyltransferase domain-containing protein [Candidatus Eremiobacteraeota bacterium]|nr:methyltransferase domain-containing protein [Candidatus Eremiobacteraeota bacterium]
MTAAPVRTVDPDKLHAFVGKVLGDLGAAASAALTIIGDKLGLYRELAKGDALSPSELAARTGTAERYVREWLANQAASGYVDYDPATQLFSLPPERAFMLADESSPLFIQGAFQLIEAMSAAEPQISERFRTGKGFGWHEHDPRLFEGTERFFRPGYNANLIGSWIPALDGVEARLRSGGKVADVGCGLGASTIIMAQAFPNATFHGFDYHAGSIELARRRAQAAGVADRVEFTVASAKDFPGKDYDLIAYFDCLHDMGDPVGAAKYVRSALATDGVWMLVEPFANDRLEDNLNPIGRIYYAASTMLCTPGSLAQEVGLALGAQAGEKRLRSVVEQAGLTHFRRATETPFNIVYEIKR